MGTSMTEIGRINLLSSSTGTGTTKTQMNGASLYTIDEGIKELVKLFIRSAATAAYTASETNRKVVFLESGDVKIDPVRIAYVGASGGLGVSPMALIPIVDGYELNIPIEPAQRIDLQAQSLIADTAAMRVGGHFKVSDRRSGLPEVFWDVSGSNSPAVTAAGTAAARVQLTNMTLQSMRKIVRGYGALIPTTVTASQDYIAWLEFISSSFVAATPFEFGLQPIASNLGTAVGVGTARYGVEDTDRSFKPGQAQVTLEQYINIEEALTGNGSLIAGVACIK